MIKQLPPKEKRQSKKPHAPVAKEVDAIDEKPEKLTVDENGNKSDKKKGPRHTSNSAASSNTTSQAHMDAKFHKIKLRVQGYVSIPSSGNSHELLLTPIEV